MTVYSDMFITIAGAVFVGTILAYVVITYPQILKMFFYLAIVLFCFVGAGFEIYFFVMGFTNWVYWVLFVASGLFFGGSMWLFQKLGMIDV